MYDNETAIIRMIKNGAGGYVLKDAEPSELKTALYSLQEKGFYYSELVTGHLVHTISKMGDDTKAGSSLQLNERELEFLKYACTELSYKEIADKMFLSPRTIDGYRDALFEKLDIRSRVGLVIYAIKNRIVNIDSHI
jgi:DNA-binding NarL/FixJ family response regulator